MKIGDEGRVLHHTAATNENNQSKKRECDKKQKGTNGDLLLLPRAKLR